MSDLLVVIPEGWTEVDSSWIDQSNSITEVNNMLSQEAWGDIEGIMVLTSQLPEGQHVLKARLITQDDGYHLWVMFG